MLGNIFGVLIFTLLAILRISQAIHGDWIAIFLALQSGLAVWLYFLRKTPKKSAGKVREVFAWASALLPLAFSPGASSNAWQALLIVPGLLLALWAMFSLRQSFSIAPADRGLVQRGPYKLMRHPMYVGEIFSLAGTLISAFSFWNVLVFALFIGSVFWRIRQEEALIKTYDLYSSKVPCVLLFGWLRKERMMDNRIKKILEDASRLCRPRKEFFYEWVKTHFDLSEIEHLEAHLATLSQKNFAYEVNLVAEEYAWCRDSDLEKICCIAGR